MTDTKRVDRIRELLTSVDRTGPERSAVRWEASKLIWEELQTRGGDKPHIGLADEIGCSRANVLWMGRCWELARGSGYDLTDLKALPRFNDVYHSDEVRQPDGPRGGSVTVVDGMGGQGSASQNRGEPLRGATVDPRDAAAAWVGQVVEAVELLETHRVSWAFLTVADVDSLAGIPDRITALLADMREPAKSAKSAK